MREGCGRESERERDSMTKRERESEREREKGGPGGMVWCFGYTMQWGLLTGAAEADWAFSTNPLTSLWLSKNRRLHFRHTHRFLS